MRSEWVCDDIMALLLAAMTPDNRRVIQVSLATGLRLGDVLSLTTEKIAKKQRISVRDQKTGKSHRVWIPQELRLDLLANAGPVWVFPGRMDRSKHRTRNTVYKDMMKAAATVKRAGWLDPKKHVSPHSARKIAAVKTFQRGGLIAAQHMLMHDTDHPEVTMLYALADQLDSRPSSRRRQSRNVVRSIFNSQIGQQAQGEDSTAD